MLLYDGEELVGAKQNRILNVSVLVGAGAKLPIPVSCVEQGRWSRQSDAFGSAKHISHSHLRRRKAEMLAAQPLARGLAQGDVWDEVRDKQERMGVRSRDRGEPRHVRSPRRPGSARSSRRSRSRPASAGPCSRSGDDLCLDAVSRPDAFALLWPKLRAGYLLDALERLDRRATSVERISAFVDDVGRSAARPAARRPGSARTFACAARASSARASSSNGETIQLSAFTSEDDGTRAFGRIARPSRQAMRLLYCSEPPTSWVGTTDAPRQTRRHVASLTRTRVREAVRRARDSC